MMIKKSSILLICILSICLITGCSNNEESLNKSLDNENVVGDSGSNSSEINSLDDLTSDTGTLSCTREAKAGEGITPKFSYTVKYKNGNILELHSIEMIISDDEESLDTYENAYKDINKNYDKLKYYDTKVIRDNNSVSRDTLINYDKIDIDALLDLEGEKDNIIKNGKAKLDLWLDLASQFGTKCEEE